MKKNPCLWVKMYHNATAKYATTMQAAWNVKLLGNNRSKMFAQPENIVTEVTDNQFGLFLFFRNSIKLTLNLVNYFK
jgi:hypothetical protein